VAFEVPEPRVRHVALAQVERLEVGEALRYWKPLVRHLGSGQVHGKVRHAATAPSSEPSPRPTAAPSRTTAISKCPRGLMTASPPRAISG
jgi:hypothetical protein